MLIDEASADVFRQLITIVAALGIHDERVIEEAKKYVSKNKITKNRILEFVEMSPSISLNFEEMIREIEIKTWDRLSFAKSVIGESQFAKWMEDNTTLSDKTIKNYCGAIRKVSNDLIKMDFAYSSLNDIFENAELNDLKEKYFSITQ